MALNVKSLGNALAMKSRGLENHANQQISPGNVPIAPQGTPDTFEVPADALQGVVEGDILTVTAIGDTVTLTKQAAPPAPEPTAPPIP
jgi:hypothetical protein